MFRFPPVPNNCQGHVFHVCLWKSISSGSKIIVNNSFCCFSFSLDKCFLQFKMIVKDMFCSFQSQLRSMFSNKEIPFSLWMSHTNTKLKCIIVCTKTCKGASFWRNKFLFLVFRLNAVYGWMPFDGYATVIHLSKNIEPRCLPVEEKTPVSGLFYWNPSFDAGNNQERTLLWRKNK